MKNTTLYILVAVIFIAILGAGIFMPKPTDWSFSYSKYDKKPFGAYILHELVKDLFPNKPFSEKHKEEIVQNTSEDADYADDTDNKAKVIIKNEQPENPKNYIFFNQDFLMNNSESISNLLAKVREGSHVFIAAEVFSDNIQSNLGFQVTGKFSSELHYDIYEKNLRHPSPLKVNFENEKLARKTGYQLDELAATRHFVLDKNFGMINYTAVLATDAQKNPILIKIQYGMGSFVLCSAPLAFTNYYLLTKDGEAFANNALSYMPIQETVWDEYYKFDNLKDVEEGRSKALRYIQSQPPLNWAMWLMIFTSLIYMLVEMKRRQRIIKEIKPLQNSTLEFTETIGQLYFRSQDHKNVAEKISRSFLDYIRNRYYLRTQEFDKEFFEVLAAKSGVTKDYLGELFDQIKRIRRSEQILEDDLISLSSKVEKFYEVAK